MFTDIFDELETRMKKTIEILRQDFATLRAGRANPALLEKIKVEYYGTLTPLQQMANVSAPEPRLLTVQPWDKSVLAEIEKAILKSDLGLNPTNDGSVLRISIPQLTQESREELVKTIRKKTEDAKVGIRNIRRESNDLIKRQEKEKGISEDMVKKAQDEIQKITDRYIQETEQVFNIKEKELREV